MKSTTCMSTIHTYDEAVKRVVTLKFTANQALWIHSAIDLQLGLMDMAWLAWCMASSVYS